MLANGIKLNYKLKSTDTAYKNLSSLKKVPDFGSEPEKVENTPLNAKNKQYELGVGDVGDLEYTFVYGDASKIADETRLLFNWSNDKTVIFWEMEYPDGTKYAFHGIPSAKVVGGDLNAPLELVVKIALNSDITQTFKA